MELKTCTKCKIEQDVENFYIRRTRGNTRKSICKECESKSKARPVEVVPDLEGEIWKDIIGFEGIYLVSNMGRVKRIMHRKNPTNTIMHTSLNGGGYHRLSLSRSGKRYDRILSRLVGIAHIPNPENKPEVNHLKGKDDNRACSLEWSTTKENIRHAWDTGLSTSKKGQDANMSKLTEKEVLEIRAIKGMTKRDIAKSYNIGEAAVGKIINRQRWTHI